MSQTFDLEELLGVDVSDRPEIIQSFAQSVIDKILDRTEEGKAIGGKKDLKKPYSKSYTESDVFAAYGKSKNDINMTLRGQMLADLDITSIDGNKVTIGFSDDLQVKKAYNHNVGDTVNKRPFFGVRKGEISDDINEIKEVVEQETSQEQSIILDAITALESRETAQIAAASLFDDVFGGLFDEG